MWFNVKEKLVLSDPIHEDIDGVRNIIIENPMIGRWGYDIETIDFKVSALTAYYIDYDIAEGKDWDWLINIPVESEQIGIFNETQYFPEDTEWFDDCLKISKCNHYGTMLGGLITSTGYGNGEYSVYTQELIGKVVAIRVEFIKKLMY